MIQSYKDLIVWQKAMQMTEMVYSMAKKTSEGGNVCPERPNEAGSGVDSFEHCRGLRAKFKERVHPIFVYSKRIWIRTGNTNDVGIEHPEYGTVTLDNRDITAMPMFERARAGIGYLPQEASIFSKMTVEDNLLSRTNDDETVL